MVLVTGATGFLGRGIQKELISAGHTLRILVRPGSSKRRFAEPGTEVCETPLHEPESLRQALSGVTAIIYCAGTIRGGTLGDFLPANVDGVQAMLHAMDEEQCAAPVLLISSLAASRPEVSDYAHSKYLGEQALRQSRLKDWTILRPPAVYGRGDRELLPILKMARRGLVVLPGARNQRLSLLYAHDAASAVLAWLKAWQDCSGQTFTIDDGHPGGHTWQDIVRSAGGKRMYCVPVPVSLLSSVARINVMLSRLTGRAPMLTPGKVRELTQPHWLCDNSAFTAKTGWMPRVDLETGISLTLNGDYGKLANHQKQ